MGQPLELDGSYGEGGGQILRTALTAAALTGRSLEIHSIRAGRPKPGLAAQHLTAVRAAGALCQAVIEGDSLGSQRLRFAPQAPVRPGNYRFDVAAAREGGSAGAASLVLQTVVLPLALADGTSDVTVRGGTHMAWSPSFDYLSEVWGAVLARLGFAIGFELHAFGWYPVGQGEIRATIAGAAPGRRRLHPVDLLEPGPLVRVTGRALAANLPAHISQRMADRARALLTEQGVESHIRPERVRAACPGAGIFLTAEYANLRCGFSALGAVGKPAEAVAEEAAQAVLRHRASGAALDLHLGDQLLLPLALTEGPSRFTVEQVTLHLETNAWVIESFELARIRIETEASGIGRVTVSPVGTARGPALRPLTETYRGPQSGLRNG